MEGIVFERRLVLLRHTPFLANLSRSWGAGDISRTEMLSVRKHQIAISIGRLLAFRFGRGGPSVSGSRHVKKEGYHWTFSCLPNPVSTIAHLPFSDLHNPAPFYLLTPPLPYFNPSNTPFNLSHPSLPSQLSFALPSTLLTALLAFPFHLPPISGTSPP